MVLAITGMSNNSFPDRSKRRWYVVPYVFDTYYNLVCTLVVAAEVVILLVVTVLALYVQFKDRPVRFKIYHTNDPWETVRKGETYACGCSLPPTIQSRDKADMTSEKPDPTINRCYERSELETVNILMFPTQTAGPTLQPVLDAFVPQQDVYYSDMPDGYFVGQQAHDLSGNVTYNPPKDDIKHLFLSGRRQGDYLPTVDYLQSFEFMTFPWSFLRLAFSYNCTNCTTCALERINEMSKNVSNRETWATCFYWGLGDTCQTDNTYKAKCLLYPSTSLPPNFAIKRFFGRLLNFPGIAEKDIHSVTPNYTQKENLTSFQPSSLYLNISQIEKSSIPMGFVEFVRGSAFYLALRIRFSAMDTSCSNITSVRVCNGTSVCNVFTDYTPTTTYQLRCLDLVDRDKCLRLMNGSSPDNAQDLRQAGRQGNWDDVNCGLANRPPQCFNAMPYLLAWNISQRMARKMDSLNTFLYNNILYDKWTQRTGVCTNTFEDVIRYPSNNSEDNSASGNEFGGDDHAIYLESNCTFSALGGEYCWLTGRYHNITDGPNKSGQLVWKELLGDSLFPDAPPSPRFVCYRVDPQRKLKWFIVSFGIVFGWIGTVHLIFQCLWSAIGKKPGVKHPLDRPISCFQSRFQWRLFGRISSSLWDSGSKSDIWSDSSPSGSSHPAPLFTTAPVP